MTIIKGGTGLSLSRRTFLARTAGTTALLLAGRSLLPGGAWAAPAAPEVTGVKLGFIALTDAAPLIIAKEKGLFEKHGMPDVEVLVCTIRALKYQSGRFNIKPGKPLPESLFQEDLDALQAGRANLEGHLDILRKYGIPIVVAINRFPTDTDREIQLVREIALAAGATHVAVSDAFARGGIGSEDLARQVISACQYPSQFRFLYDLKQPLIEKLEILAREIYGADGIEVEPLAKKQLEAFQNAGFGELPVCVAKTQYSFSHDPKLLARPTGYRFPIREARLSAGAGFVYVLAGEMSTLPGLPGSPSALRIGVDDAGNISGVG